MNKNGKKLGIFSFLLFLLTALFTLASHNASAEETTPAVSVTGKFADTITIVNVSNNAISHLVSIHTHTFLIVHKSRYLCRTFT